MTDPNADLGTCDAKDCEQPATRPVLTNYGWVGNVCDQHFAEIADLLGRPVGSVV